MEFEQNLLPGGRLTIDGFMCVFDVSQSSNRRIESQVEFLSNVLTTIIKTKKPCVLATTKNDQAYEPYVKEAEKLAGRKEFRGNIPLIETSAHDNVNVELAYLYLANMIEKGRIRVKNLNFVDAARARQELVDVATEAFKNLIRNQVKIYC